MITIASHIWDPNEHSFSFSRMYDESWVEKLYRGFARNLTQPFEFVVYSEKPRVYAEPIIQLRLKDAEPSYGSCIQLYELDKPTIIVGLDTVITGNVDALANHAQTASKIALPRDPNSPYTACNGCALVPAGNARIYTEHDGTNDMLWMRRQPHDYIDDVFPGFCRSFKGGVLPGVRDTGLQDTRICYFHGEDKPHQIKDEWLLDHWK